MSNKTFFIDIDGTILRHLDSFTEVMKTEDIPSLPDAAEKICKWLSLIHI